MDSKRKSSFITLKEIAVFALLGTIMFVSKMLMEFLPNIHLLGVLTIAFTAVYRAKALFPIYVYVFLNGLIAGFGIWWVPYLYIWTVLWGAVMLVPRNLSKKATYIIYAILCTLHGLCFGLLYAPCQALFFGLNFSQTVAWVIAGLPFDLIQAVGNGILSVLIMPVVSALKRIK